tara:strand:- start:1384 stop:2262 length:879 start_codon:yes stop_codon:yes gene_type:complete
MRELEKHVYFYDTVVIGGNLPAFIYAYTNSLPIIFVDGRPPFEFDRFGKEEDLSFLGIEAGTTIVQLQVWDRLIFLLGMSGLMPLSDMAENIRIKENLLSVVTRHSRLVRIKFNKLIIFDDKKISGLPAATKKEKEKNRVIDWVNVRSGCSHDVNFLVSDEDFVSKVTFYPTKRSENKNNKDLFVESYLADEQLKEFNFSDTMVKFKVLDMMKKAGIRGTRNGRNPSYPDKSSVPYKYYALKIEPAERVVYSATKRFYKPDSRFEFRYEDTKEALFNAERPEGYLGKLSDMF